MGQGSQKSISWQASLLGTLVAFIAWLGTVGIFDPFDNALRDIRFELDNREATKEVVLVEIDPKSLEHFGVWPWPRDLHAKLIDALVEYGAYNIAFDIDFSSRSTSQNDQAMAAALDRAGGFVILASFAQQTNHVGGISFNQPIGEFASNSWAASVNVHVDRDGRVRKFPFSSQIDGKNIASFPALLAGYEGNHSGEFHIDYSIDASQITRVSYIDVLNGSVADELLADKHVIIGAGAVELRDNFSVARYGVISGPMLQVLATETLLQSRNLKEVGFLPSLFIISLMGLFYIWRIGKLSFAQAMAGMAASIIGLELTGFVLQSWYGLLLNTGVMHVAQLVLVLGYLAAELDRRLGAIRRASREKQVTQAILNQVITDNFDGVIVVDDTHTIRMASSFAELLLDRTNGNGLVGSLAKDVLPDGLLMAVAQAFEPQSDGASAYDAPTQFCLQYEGEAERYLEFVVTRSVIEASFKSGWRHRMQNASQVVSCLTFRDVTASRRSARKLEYIAHHDPLTGALSRVKFSQEIAKILDTDTGLGNGLTMGIVDLRRFKEVNETLGHSVGDQLLSNVVSRLKNSQVDFVGRVGGDSFAFCILGVKTSAELARTCDELITSLCAPYQLSEHRVIIGANIGVTDSFLSGSFPDIMLAHADMALSQAESNARNSHYAYNDDLEQLLLRKRDVERALRRALANDELWVAYQPQIELATGKLIGVEALVRWQHPDWGVVPPDQFIPIAEEIGLIVEIGRWILEKACNDAVSWPVPIKLAVNVSPLQFEFSNVEADVIHALTMAGLSADRLDIEITEGSFVDHSEEILKTLRNLQASGIGVALDDFGTGYSSLSYLARLPIDKIKVDQSFVRKLPEDQETAAIVQSVLTLGAALNKTIVAEGIETHAQAKLLELGGAQIGQGYLYSRPMNDVDLRGYMLKEFWSDQTILDVG